MSIEVVDLVLGMASIDLKVFDAQSLKSRQDLAAEITDREVKFYVDRDSKKPVREARGVSLLVQDERGAFLLETGRSYWKNGQWVHRPKLKPQTASETLVRLPHKGGEPDRYESIDVAACRCAIEELDLPEGTGTFFRPKNSYPYLDVRPSNVYYGVESVSLRNWCGLKLDERMWPEGNVFEDTQKVRLHTKWFDEWPFDFPPFEPPLPDRLHDDPDEYLARILSFLYKNPRAGWSRQLRRLLFPFYPVFAMSIAASFPSAMNARVASVVFVNTFFNFVSSSGFHFPITCFMTFSSSPGFFTFPFAVCPEIPTFN
jgi:hypothetical protein